MLFYGGQFDLYGYCLNDPINWTDSKGLMKEIRFSENGIRDAIGYGAVVTVTDKGKVLFVGVGSTYPDISSDPDHAILMTGVHIGQMAEMKTKRIIGIYVKNNPSVIRGGELSTSRRVFIHCGKKGAVLRGSTGCLTLMPSKDQCERFFQLFDMNEPVIIIIERQ